MQSVFFRVTPYGEDVSMDLSEDTDIATDCCPTGVADEIKHGSRMVNFSKAHSLKEDRCDSNYSSGFISGNLPSDLGEGRYASDEDRLIPVAGLESLTLDNSEDDKSKHLDEGFGDEYLSSEKNSRTLSLEQTPESLSKESDSEEEKDEEKLRQYRQLLLETYQQDDDGDTRLHTSIIQLLSDVSLYFISLTPTHTLLNLKNNYLQTPLHLAVITKQDVLTRKLMAAGAQVDSRDHKGNTPLHIVSREGYSYFAQILLEPIHYEETVQNRYDLPHQEIPQNMEARNYDGQVCVHLAAEGSHIETLDVLLSKGANVNARDGKSGRTALHYAAESGCMRLLSYLLQQKHCNLDINCTTYGGLTPLMLAKGRGHDQAVRLLRESGAWSDTDESSSEEEMNEEPYEDIKINGIIVN